MRGPELLPLFGFDRWAIETTLGFRLWLSGGGVMRRPNAAEVACATAIAESPESGWELLKAKRLVVSVAGVQ